MARRNRFRSRGGQPGVFSLADMRDVLTSANDSLVDAIAAQNPNIDADGFETELRELVSRYGRGTGAGAVPGFPTMASAAPSQTRYEYNLSGDLLVAASEYFAQGNYAAFFQSVRDAFRSDDAPKLFAAIAEMNSMTDVEDQAMADDNESDILPDDNTELESDDLPSGDDFEVYSSDDEDDDPLGRDAIMADLENDDPGDHEFRGTESPSPMPSGNSDDDPATTASTDDQRREMIAFMNKITMSGSSEDRQKATVALKRLKAGK